MKRLLRYQLLLILPGLLVITAQTALGGNKDRSGQAGASELLINPWARSSGWGNVNTANARGLEAMFINIAGTAFTPRTEIGFCYTTWLKGSDVSINAFGLTQKVGESGVFGLSVMSMAFGDIEITTVDQPEGGIGTFSPNLLNINLSYSKAFSNSIYGGLNIKLISEAIADMNAQGVAIDAGIQYVTGPTDNITFGIALKNIGPTMRFNGDGLSFRGFIPGQDNQFTVEQRSEDFELPSLLSIGAAYDLPISELHRMTIAGNFVSNSFTKDQINLGAEYAFKEMLMLRAGFAFEDGIFDEASRTSVYTGPTAGITIDIPFNKEKTSSFAVDYSYAATNPFQGTHRIGARINF